MNTVKVGLAPDFPNDYRFKDDAGIQGPIPIGCVRETPEAIRCPRNAEFPELPTSTCRSR